MGSTLQYYIWTHNRNGRNIQVCNFCWWFSTYLRFVEFSWNDVNMPTFLSPYANLRKHLIHTNCSIYTSPMHMILQCLNLLFHNRTFIDLLLWHKRDKLQIPLFHLSEYTEVQKKCSNKFYSSSLIYSTKQEDFHLIKQKFDFSFPL